MTLGRLLSELWSAVLAFSLLLLRTQKDIIEFELLLCDLDTDSLAGLLQVALLILLLLLHGRLMTSGRRRLLASMFAFRGVLLLYYACQIKIGKIEEGGGGRVNLCGITYLLLFSKEGRRRLLLGNLESS